MNKEEIKSALQKRPSELSKEELSELFEILCLNIKEYQIKGDSLFFEIHFRRTYLIRVEYPIKKGWMSFRNEFINFEEENHGYSMKQAQNTGELINIFINMFYHNLLVRSNYQVYYDEEISRYTSPEEAQEYLECVQSALDSQL